MSKATGPTYNVPFGRRRRNLTNYAKRLALLKGGTRLVVRKTLSHIIVQFTGFSEKGDVVLASALSSELAEFKWPEKSNAPTAYLTAFLAAKKALAKGVKSAVLDVGISTPCKGGVFYSAAKGAADAGMKIPLGEEVLEASRIKGEHIAAYAKSLKGTPRYEKQFSAYIKSGVEPEKIPELFEKIKEKLSAK